MSRIYKESKNNNYFFNLEEDGDDGDIDLTIVDNDGDNISHVLTIRNGKISYHTGIDRDAGKELGLKLDELGKPFICHFDQLDCL